MSACSPLAFACGFKFGFISLRPCLMFPSPAYLATVAVRRVGTALHLEHNGPGFRRLLFLSIWVDFAFASFKDDRHFSKLQALELQVS